MGLLSIDPSILNSASPWATSEQDLQQLFDCRHTGAITIRTAVLKGFMHDDAVHQYLFFEGNAHCSQLQHSGSGFSSLNTLGYSPVPFNEYLQIIARVIKNSSLPDAIKRRKPCIISVTGSCLDVARCHLDVMELQNELQNAGSLCLEVNLSCPNIPNEPPPAYSKSHLDNYIHCLSTFKGKTSVPVGLKTPPYTYHDQYQTLIDALLEPDGQAIDFITATNTLGSSLVLSGNGTPAISSASGTGVGGMAGASLHPLALGNVMTLRSMLDQHESLRHIDIIGVGGVHDRAGYDRMRAVGAKAVAVGTALGLEGIGVFEKILQG